MRAKYIFEALIVGGIMLIGISAVIEDVVVKQIALISAVFDIIFAAGIKYGLGFQKTPVTVMAYSLAFCLVAIGGLVLILSSIRILNDFWIQGLAFLIGLDLVLVSLNSIWNINRPRKKLKGK